MKTVFSNSMVFHVWAQQNQSEGRNGKSTIYFRDSMLFSYRDSAEIARFVKNKRGERAVLLSTQRWSCTTAIHQGAAHRAIQGLDLPTFNVYNMDTNFARHKAQYVASIAESMLKAVRARLRAEWHVEQAQALTTEANAFSKFFGLRWRLEMPVLDDETIAKVRAAVKADAIKRKKEILARDERQRAEAIVRANERSTAIRLWLAGEDVHIPGDYPRDRDDPTLLRIHGENVETSRGAEIPVDHAKRVWPIIKRCVMKGVGYVRNGHTEHVGQFAIDRIEPDGTMQVGCHLIKYDEVQKIANQLGLA